MPIFHFLWYRNRYLRSCFQNSYFPLRQEASWRKHFSRPNQLEFVSPREKSKSDWELSKGPLHTVSILGLSIIFPQCFGGKPRTNQQRRFSQSPIFLHQHFLLFRVLRLGRLIVTDSLFLLGRRGCGSTRVPVFGDIKCLAAFSCARTCHIADPLNVYCSTLQYLTSTQSEPNSTFICSSCSLNFFVSSHTPF